MIKRRNFNYQVNTANNLGVVCGSGKFLRTKTTIVQRNLCRNNSEENKITKKLKTVKFLV